MTRRHPGRRRPPLSAPEVGVRDVGRPRWPRAYSFLIVTAGLFAFSWAGQFFSQLVVVRQEAESHGQPFAWGLFWPQFLASTFENWQSEFLQLCWQAAGLSLLLFWGSSQSRESSERIEAKVDHLLRLAGTDADVVTERVNRSL